MKFLKLKLHNANLLIWSRQEKRLFEIGNHEMARDRKFLVITYLADDNDFGRSHNITVFVDTVHIHLSHTIFYFGKTFLDNKKTH